MPYFIHFVALVCFLVSPLAASKHPDADHAQTVRAFVAAFNKHDVEAMAAFVTDDVQWLGINGASISIEADGKPVLISAMQGYFQSCPSCQSDIEQMMVSGERVSAIEVAAWEGKNGRREQRSLSVYEFSGALISRVYYFPAER